MDLRSFDAALWRKVCDDEAIGKNHWIRDNPRPRGPAGNCLCQWCMTTRRYIETNWWLIPRKCAECSQQFLPKVKAQTYCDEHRHLAGAPIRPLETGDHSAGVNDGTR